MSLVEDGLLFVGGEDSLVFEELKTASAQDLFKILKKPLKLADVTNKAHQDILRQLIVADILVPQSPKKLKVWVEWLGASPEAHEQKLFKVLVTAKSRDHADLLVFIRSGGTWMNSIEQYDCPTIPHVLFDAANNHTLSYGPLVFKGMTACIGCLYGRLATTWGTAPVSKAPRMRRFGALQVGTLEHIIAVIQNKPEYLVNKTVVHDLLENTITENPILRYPDCLNCSGDDSVSAKVNLWWQEK